MYRPELLAIMLTEQRFECPCSVDATDLLIDAVGTQQVARPSVRADDAQRDAARGEFGMQLVQHARAGEIEIRRCGKIADDDPDSRMTACAEAVQDRFQTASALM